MTVFDQSIDECIPIHLLFIYNCSQILTKENETIMKQQSLHNDIAIPYSSGREYLLL